MSEIELKTSSKRDDDYNFDNYTCHYDDNHNKNDDKDDSKRRNTSQNDSNR